MPKVTGTSCGILLDLQSKMNKKFSYLGKAPVPRPLFLGFPDSQALSKARGLLFLLRLLLTDKLTACLDPVPAKNQMRCSVADCCVILAWHGGKTH